METTVALIGKGVFGKIIGDTYNNVKHIQENYPDHCHVKMKINELDILPTIDIIDSMVDSIKEKMIKTHPIKNQIKNIKTSLSQINQDLGDIEKVTKEHKEKYFSYMRNPDYSSALKNLELHFAQLNNRFDLLVKLTKIESSISKLDATGDVEKIEMNKKGSPKKHHKKK